MSDIWGVHGIVGRNFVPKNENRRRVYGQLKYRLLKSDCDLRKQEAERLQLADLRIDPAKGFLITDPGRFPEVEEMINHARTVVSSTSLEATGRKQYLVSGLLDQQSLDLDSPYIRFILRDDVISAVSSYLGVVPIVPRVDILYSPNESTDTTGSQLYHCDWDANEMVKVFVYVSDVDDHCGPLTLVQADASKRVRDRLKYSFHSRRSVRERAEGRLRRVIGSTRGPYPSNRVRDEDMRALIESNEEHKLKGPAGTVIFADTCNCFHFGSRPVAPSSPRTVILIEFLTPLAFSLPLDLKKAATFNRLGNSQLTRAQQMVLGSS